MDETWCTSVQAPPRIVALTDIKQIGSTKLAELITVICAINATGNHIPPILMST